MKIEVKKEIWVQTKDKKNNILFDENGSPILKLKGVETIIEEVEEVELKEVNK
jgi:hypothetical protein